MSAARGDEVVYLSLTGETWDAVVAAVGPEDRVTLLVGSFELELSRVPLDDTRTLPGSWSPLGQGEGD